MANGAVFISNQSARFEIAILRHGGGRGNHKQWNDQRKAVNQSVEFQEYSYKPSTGSHELSTWRGEQHERLWTPGKSLQFPVCAMPQ